MKQQKLSWREIVENVEKANLERQVQEMKHLRSIEHEYQNYQTQKIQEKQIISKHEQVLKQSERLRLERQFQEQKIHEEQLRQSQKRKEIEYQTANKSLLQIKESWKKEQRSYGEHPFVALVEQQDKRVENFKKKMRMQNEINNAQYRIKLSERKYEQERDIKDKQMYVKYVDSFYKQKIQERQLFKKKYLSLTKQSPGSLQLINQKQTVDQQYQQYLQKQIFLKEESRRKKDILDEHLLKLNKKLEQPNSSPAYLGRNFMSDDRRKQIKYMEKQIHSFQSNTKPINQRVKTEGDSSTFSFKSNQNINNGSGQYLNVKSKAKQNGDNAIFDNGFQFKQIDSQKQKNDRKVLNPENDVNKREQSTPQMHKKAFMSYDIVLGKKKLIYI